MENKEAKEMSVEERADLKYGKDRMPGDAERKWGYIDGWNDHAQQQQSAFIKLLEGEIAVQSIGDSIDNQYTVDVLNYLLSKAKEL